MPIQTPLNPFWFPHTSPVKSVYLAQRTPSIGPAWPLTIFEKTTGNAGVVRSIMVAANSVLVDLEVNLHLNIHYDGNAVADVSVPFGALFGLDNAADFVGQGVFTPFFGMPPGGNPKTMGSYRLTYPIPYTNGIKITFSVTGGILPSAWTNVIYQDTLPACWNRNLRLFMSQTSASVAAAPNKTGTVSVTVGSQNVTGTGTDFDSTWVGKCLKDQTTGTGRTYSVGNDDLYVTAVSSGTALTISSTDVQQIQTSGTLASTGHRLFNMHTFVSRGAGSRGWVAAMYMGLVSGLADYTSMLEGNPRLWLSGGTEPDITWAGTEDFLYGAFYWDNALANMAQQQDEDGGVTARNITTGKITGYRVFARDPLRYTNGLTGRWPNIALGDTITSTWTTVYYEEV